MWKIVDAREQPEAWQKCRTLEIDIFTCPLGHRGPVQGPLLLRDSSAKRLIYSPSPIADAEEAQVDLEELLSRIAKSASPADIGVLRDGLTIVSRDCLPLGMLGRPPDLISEIEAIHRAVMEPLTDRGRSQRVELCRRGLELAERDLVPRLWSLLQSKLSMAISHPGLDPNAREFEEAARAAELAVAALTPERDVHQWAFAQHNLGSMYIRRRGRQGEDIEKAIACFQNAIPFFESASGRFQHALLVAIKNLADAFLARTKGDRAENIETAIRHYQEIVPSLGKPGPDWQGVLHNLGIAYYERRSGDLAANVNMAIDCYIEALSMQAAPEQRLLTQMDLGNAYMARIDGDRLENVERAIATYTDALDTATMEGSGFEQGRLLFNLSNAYGERLVGKREDNQEIAIQAAREALSLLEPGTEDWGRAQQNLGVAFMRRSQTGRFSEDIENAIPAFEAGLAVASTAGFSFDRVIAQEALANAYAERKRGDADENASTAIRLLQEIATDQLRIFAPRIYAGLQMNLGSSFRDRRNRTGKDLEFSIAAFKRCLAVSSEHGFSREMRQAALRLGRIYSETGEWDEALMTLVDATHVIEHSYEAAVTEQARETLAGENSLLYSALIDACLHVSPQKSREAFVYAEQARSRVFRDQLAGLPLPFKLHSSQEVIDQEISLQQTIRTLSRKLSETSDPAVRLKWAEALEQAKNELQSVWTTLSQDPAAAEYLALRCGGTLRWTQIVEWLARQKGGALLSFYSLEDRLIAFVLRSEDPSPNVFSLDITPAQLTAYIQRYLDSRADMKGNWNDILSELGQRLVGPILPLIRSKKLLYVVPHGFLHLVPIHALQIEGKSLLESLPVIFLPSVAAALNTARRAGVVQKVESTSKSHLVVGNPTKDLPFSGVEAATIAPLLSATLLLEDKAGKANILSELAGCAMAHVAAHAYYSHEDPLGSGVVLAQREVLAARDLMEKDLRLELLVLSACETGIQMVGLGDALSGLARGFMAAGVKSLILSLWRVSDFSTMLMMSDFYSRLTQGAPVQEALRAAQLRLKSMAASEVARCLSALLKDGRDDVPAQSARKALRHFQSLPPEIMPFEHPQHWAPFFLTGTVIPARA